MKQQKGQVWVETVTYLLIALILIGAVLGFIRPKIQEFQDQAIIEQTIEIMEAMHGDVLSAVTGGAGNKRTLDFSLRRGNIAVDFDADTITYTLPDSRAEYSEPDLAVEVGNLDVMSTDKGRVNEVTLMLDYAGKYNLEPPAAQNSERSLMISQSSTPYELSITNLGKPAEPGAFTSTNCASDPTVCEVGFICDEDESDSNTKKCKDIRPEITVILN